MNKTIKELVAFAKIYSIIQNEIDYPDGCNLRDSIKTDLFNWFQDNIQNIINLQQEELADGVLSENEIYIGKNYGKIKCIKEYKTRTGKGLVDSKNDVEGYFEKNYLTFGPNF